MSGGNTDTMTRTDADQHLGSGVIPYLAVRGGAQAVDFYVRVFGAELVERYDFQDKLGHATLRINGGLLNLADEFPEHEDEIGVVAPPSLDDRSTVTLTLYVSDADAAYDKAIAAGCTQVRPCTDEFYGRHGKLRDPFGHVWSLVALKSG